MSPNQSRALPPNKVGIREGERSPVDVWGESIPDRGRKGQRPSISRGVPGGYEEEQRSQFVRTLAFTVRDNGEPST